MKTNPNDPINATPKQIFGTGEDYHEIPREPGLTKREEIAIRAMQSYITSFKDWLPDRIAHESVKTADALINELNKAK